MAKQAQSAIEFLMVYGWAILIVLIAGIAFYNYGILAPGKVLPRKCNLPAGIICIDHRASLNGVTVVIRNGQGYDMRNVSVEIAGCGIAAGHDYIANGDKQIYTANCQLTGSRFNSHLDVSYILSETEVIYAARGSIITIVE